VQRRRRSGLSEHDVRVLVDAPNACGVSEARGPFQLGGNLGARYVRKLFLGCSSVTLERCLCSWREPFHRDTSQVEMRVNVAFLSNSCSHCPSRMSFMEILDEE